MSSIAKVQYVACKIAGMAGIGLAFYIAYGSIDGSRDPLGSAVLAGALLALGIGLWLLQFWARRMTAALCLLVAVLLPPGVINPFAAMDVASPPTLGGILAWLIPVVILLLATAWLVDPPRASQSAGTQGLNRGE